MKTQPTGTASKEVQCQCTAASAGENRLVKWLTAGGILSALGICAACCLLPFILLSLGIAGAWVGVLDALAPYKWIFIASTAILLGYGFYAAYVTCAAGSKCQTCRSNRHIRVALWVAMLLAIGGIAFEQVEPYLVVAQFASHMK